MEEGKVALFATTSMGDKEEAMTKYMMGRQDNFALATTTDRSNYYHSLSVLGLPTEGFKENGVDFMEKNSMVESG